MFIFSIMLLIIEISIKNQNISKLRTNELVLFTFGGFGEEENMFADAFADVRE